LVVCNHEVPASNEGTGKGRSDKGQDSADDEHNVERTGEAGVNGRYKWCSKRGGHGVDGPGGVALLDGSDDAGQVPLQGRDAGEGMA
jgi:hypothetical protein